MVAGLFLMAIVSGCVDPIEIDLKPAPPQLVVDGMITNEAHPPALKLNYTRSYNSKGSVSPPLTNAQVYLTDDQGAHYDYLEQAPGTYQLIGLVGQIGRTYTLHIITEQGKEYESAPEKMPAVTDVDQLNYEFRSRKIIDGEGYEVEENGFQAFVNTSDPAAEKNFYLWRWQGTYEVVTQPQDHGRLDSRGNWIPDPLPCCAVCWIEQSYQNVVVRSDALINGNQIIRQPITLLPIVPQTFTRNYHFEVKQ